MTYEFLSSEWINAVRALRDDVDVSTIEAPISISLNITVTQAPSGAATTAHVDTTSGVPLMEEGHLEQAELHVTIDYLTARTLFVGGNPAAAMTALMEGKIRVDGDASKLIALQSANASPEAVAIAQRIRAFTA